MNESNDLQPSLSLNEFEFDPARLISNTYVRTYVQRFWLAWMQLSMMSALRTSLCSVPLPEREEEEVAS